MWQKEEEEEECDRMKKEMKSTGLLYLFVLYL